QEGFATLLFQRAKSGVWSERADRWVLLKTAFEVPGVLMTTLVASMVSSEFGDYLEEALATVERSSEEPIARVAQAILLLRIGADRGMKIRQQSGEEVDLHQKLPHILYEVLEQAAIGAAVGTFAEAEAAILRVCRAVVTELACGRPLASRELLWLT